MRRHPEWIALALDDERRDLDVIQFREAALFGSARGVKRERETHDGDRVGLGGRAARDPRAQRSTAGQEREAVKGAVTQLRDDQGPGRIQLARWSRTAPARHPEGLLDERDNEPRSVGGLRCANEISRLDSAASPVTEDERTDG